MENASSVSQLISRQRDAFLHEQWGDDGIQPYSQRRDKTFGQFVSNYQLILLEPFIATLSGKTAVTICDGRGVEASFLQMFGLEATATDLCAHRLKDLCDEGAFAAWSEENAEALSFSDDRFDWGMVKAGLHHLPRPALGLYELLRVSREGVILLEGHDSFLLRTIRETFLRGRDWESSGNYVYRFRSREIEKVCLGLDFAGFAVHTYFLPYRGSYEAVAANTPRYRLYTGLFRCLNRLMRSQGNLFAAVIFKTEPTHLQLRRIREAGFDFVSLPRNPYLAE